MERRVWYCWTFSCILNCLLTRIRTFVIVLKLILSHSCPQILLKLHLPSIWKLPGESSYQLVPCVKQWNSTKVAGIVIDRNSSRTVLLKWRRWLTVDLLFRKGLDRRNWPWTFWDWWVWSSWGWSTRRSCGKWLVTGRRWRRLWHYSEAQRPMARYSTPEWAGSDPRCSYQTHFRVVVVAAASVSMRWPAWISGPVSYSHPTFHSWHCYVLLWDIPSII